VNFQKKTW